MRQTCSSSFHCGATKASRVVHTPDVRPGGQGRQYHSPRDCDVREPDTGHGKRSAFAAGDAMRLIEGAAERSMRCTPTAVRLVQRSLFVELPSLRSSACPDFTATESLLTRPCGDSASVILHESP